MAEYMLEPWGDDWLQASTIAAEISNTERKTPLPLDHYVPRRIRDIPEGLSIEDQIRLLDSYARDHNRGFNPK